MQSETIIIEMGLDESGLIKSLQSSGHAPKELGTAFNRCCALISAGLRTFSRIVAASERLVVEGEAPEAGSLFIRIKRVDPSGLDWYRGVCELTERLLYDTAQDFPGTVVIKRTNELE